MDADRAADELKVIRQLMERPVRYSTMSGLSGIFAGVVALAGLAADFVICPYGGVRLWFVNLVVWGCVFFVALAGTFGLTRVRERRRGMPFWSPIKTRILKTIMPHFIAAVGLTAAIMWSWYTTKLPQLHSWYDESHLIPALWMVFYGLACWQVGEFSVVEMRVLGAAFVLAGLTTAALFQYQVPLAYYNYAPYWTLGITFGGFHIIYGLVVRIRHGG